MLFHPAKVRLTVFSILFKVHSGPVGVEDTENTENTQDITVKLALIHIKV